MARHPGLWCSRRWRHTERITGRWDSWIARHKTLWWGDHGAGSHGCPLPRDATHCGGPLWKLHNDGLQRYRCRLGHALTAINLLSGQSEVIETALWTAVRTMEERAHMFTLLAHSRQEKGQEKLAERYVMQATELIAHAKHIRQILLGNL